MLIPTCNPHCPDFSSNFPTLINSYNTPLACIQVNVYKKRFKRFMSKSKPVFNLCTFGDLGWMID